MRTFNSKLVPIIRTKSDELYIKDLEGKSPEYYYNDKEIRALIKLYRETEDSRIRDKLVFSFGKYVISIAKNYQEQGLSLGDLIAEGIEGLIVAIDNFNLDMKTKFVTYSNTVVSRNMREALDRYNNIVKLPKNIRVHRMKTKRLAATLAMQGLNDSEITDAIEPLNQKYFVNPELYNKKRFDDMESNTLHSDSDDLSYDEREVDLSMTTTDLSSEIDKVLSKTLTKVEREVLSLLFGLNKLYSINSLEGVSQHMKLPLSQVKSLYNTAINKLQESDYKEVLRAYL